MTRAPINNVFDSEPQEGAWTSPQDLKLSVHPLDMTTFTSEPADKLLAYSHSDHKHAAYHQADNITHCKFTFHLIESRLHSGYNEEQSTVPMRSLERRL